MASWFAIQVISGRERRVKKTLEENKNLKPYLYEVLIPTENVSEIKKGEQKVIEKKIWPGYILLNLDLDDESWSIIKNSNGVIDFLGGDKPAPISEKEIEEIKESLKKGIVHKHKVNVGDIVKIIDGVFVNFTGNVLEVNHEKGRLSVMVSIFGRDTRVDDLEFWQVEPVTEG